MVRVYFLPGFPGFLSWLRSNNHTTHQVVNAGHLHYVKGVADDGDSEFEEVHTTKHQMGCDVVHHFNFLSAALMSRLLRWLCVESKQF